MTLRLAIAAVLLTAAPAWAVKDWSDYYTRGLQLQAAGKYREAIKEFESAWRMKPEPGTKQRLYSLEFIDYFPYYQEAICYQALGEQENALRYFNIEEDKRKIQENDDAYRDLKRRRDAVKLKLDQVNQDRIRNMRNNVQQTETKAKLAREAQKYDDALTAYAEAITMAAVFDEPWKRRLERERDQTILEKKKAEDAAELRRRIEQALAEGRRSLSEDRDTEAAKQFLSVLELDPQNAAALEGKRQADESIRARNTREDLRRRLTEGRALANEGKYSEAINPLTEAAAGGDPEAQTELERVRGIVERTEAERARNQRVQRLEMDAERLFAEKKYGEALVQFESALTREPGNVRLQDRRTQTERRLNELILDKFFPPLAPELIFTEPVGIAVDIKGETVTLDGFAIDDRRIEKIEFVVDGKVVKQVEPGQKNFPIHEPIALALGGHDVVVRVFDSQGKQFETSFRVTRHRQLHEQPWFYPAAVGTSLGLVGLGFGFQRLRRRDAIRRRFNPYIAGAPILNQEMFYGRQKLLARILNVLHHNSLMITGERRIGKTTLLYQLKKALEADDTTEYRFFPVFIDLQGVDENVFFHSVMADVIETLQPAADTMPALRYRAEEEAGYEGREFSHDLQRIVEDLKRRTPKKVKLALLIDEVDVLNAFSERINQRLRSIFMKTFSEHLVAIMSGVGVKRIWTSEGSPWYNFFDEIELTPFSREEAESLIRQPVEGYFRWDADAVDAVLRWSGGKPYLVQKVCIHAVNHMLEEGRTTVTAADVEAAREMARTFTEDEEPAEKVLA